MKPDDLEFSRCLFLFYYYSYEFSFDSKVKYFISKLTVHVLYIALTP